MGLLIIIDRAPYGDWSGREALDMAFSLAAFDQPVSLLFTGPGVNWLRQGQQAALLEQKSVERNLAAAPVFGIEAMLADRASCRRYGLTEPDLPPGVALSDVNAELLAHYAQTVLSA